jgi:hypothetical protein
VLASAPRCGFADLPAGYHHEHQSGFHNYHFTASNYQLPPLPEPPARTVVLEGFAPNLNKHLHVGALRRQREQTEYVASFERAILAYLAFAPRHADLAGRLARAVTEHATPVGSGTVARTRRIPLERRAEAAVIAWLRHRTTAYEGMVIPRVRGKRREVRRQLAAQSKRLLDVYRTGRPVDAAACPLQRALADAEPPAASAG